MNGNNRLRTVVCGSRFGQFYLEAVKALPEQFELVGLLAKGSQRSIRCAERYGIPLYTEAGQLPGDIDLACVVLRSGVMGGSGTELSLELLSRGIHVIQEQPVHHKDLAACLRAARQNGVHFITGDLYVHLPEVRRFISCARALLERQQALYIDAACATQVSFPLMHILLEALPSVRPWKINHVVKDEGPFQVLAGSLGNIPITVRAHNEVDPNDPDHYLHLLHSLTIGAPGGRLSLIDTHGPVIWHPQMHVPDTHNIPGELAMGKTEHLLENSAQPLGPVSSASYKQILMNQWPHAIGRDLIAMRDLIKGDGSADTRAQQELLCARQWHDLTHALGYPVLRSHSGHQPLSATILREAASQIDETVEECAAGLALPSDTENGSIVCTEAVGNVSACTKAGEGQIQGIETGQVRDCVERLDAAALTSMLYTLQSQGTLTSPAHAYSEEDIFSALEVADRHRQLIVRWLEVLADRGFLKRRGGYFKSTNIVTNDLVRLRWDSAMEAWDGKLGSRKIIDYLISNAERLPELMSGRQQAALLLFPEGRMDIANALYRETAVARFLNASVAEAVIRIAAGKQAASGGLSDAASETSLRILEIGAGTGATTDVIVSRLKGAVSNRLKPEYLFTDISQFFIAAARERYKECQWMRYRVIDIDKNLFEQGLEPESVDVVIAAGMLNNARDTDQVMKGLMRCLVPGGWLLITEPVREFTEMLISQAFMMTRPEDDRRKTNTTFMTVEQWLGVFRNAGALEAAALPEEEHPLAPLGQKLFVVRKGTDAEMQPHFM